MIKRFYKRIYRQSSRWHNLLNLAITLVILSGLLYLFYVYLPDVRPDPEVLLAEAEKLQLRVEAYGFVAPVAFVGISVVAHGLFTPTTVIAVAGGLIFGFVPGFLLCLLALVLSSQTYYWMAQYVGKPFVLWFGRDEWELFQRDNPMKSSTILFFRLNYFIPFHGFSAVCGAMPLPFGRYIVVSMLGMIPSLAVAVFLGSALGPESRLLIPALTVWVGLVVGRILFGIWHMRQLVSTQEDPE